MTIKHPLQKQDSDVMAQMRQMLAPMKGSMNGTAAREPYDQMIANIPGVAAINYEPAQIGGVPGWWCRPPQAAAGAAILYLHGGAYVIGSAQAYRNFAGQVAARAGVAAFVADYRLAPEHPFPAAVDDATAAYNGLSTLGFNKIALVGDSAGGGLTLAVLPLLAAPAAAAVISPWTDLALSGSTITTRADADPILTKETLTHMAGLYLAGHDPRDSKASPLFGNLSGLPPIRIHVGDDEVLLDDSVRYGERVESAGGTVEVHVWEGMIHVFPSNVAMLQAAREALDDIAVFLERHLA